MKTFLEWINENHAGRTTTDEITVAASDDETFDKYGEEIDFVIDVSWNPEGELEDFENAKVKEARLNGVPMTLAPELIEFGIKKLKEGWDDTYSHMIGDIAAKRKELYDGLEQERDE